MAGKRAKQIFQKLNKCARKNVMKKTSEKSAKKRFLQSHEYRDLKYGGKNARNNISRNKPLERAKNVGKKLSQKVRKNVFSIHTNICPKNGRETRETIFPETQEKCEEKCEEKNRRKKVRKNVFYNHTNIMT